MPPTKTWKKVEQRIAAWFGSRRTPLSGGNSGHTRSDSLHHRLFVEAKHRVTHTAVTLWRQTAKLAAKERKVPVVCLHEKGKEGFWILVHTDHLEQVAEERKIARENQPSILPGSEGTEGTTQAGDSDGSGREVSD